MTSTLQRLSLVLASVILLTVFTWNSIPAGAQQEVLKEDRNKILLDSSTRYLDTATIQGNRYHIFQHNNILPFASGIEIVDEKGDRVTNDSIARSILRAVAWKEAALLVATSDIDTLKGVLQTAKEIDQSISPVRKATGYVISGVNTLDKAAINVLGLGRISAWDVVERSYPAISTIEGKMRSLDEDLKAWGQASSQLNSHLPIAIDGLEKIAKGEGLNQDIQSEIENSISGLTTLRDKTEKSIALFNDALGIVSSAQSGLEKAVGNKYVGGLIRPLANGVSECRQGLDSLLISARSFSNSLSSQMSKLDRVTKKASERETELYKDWAARQNAATKVYILVGVFAAVLLAICILVVFKMRKKGDTKLS